jgi:beta-galactosidase
MGDNTDIYCPQYPGVRTLEKYLEKWQPKTFISSEYSHHMGNSGGNLADLWDIFYRSDNDQLQGGYIWDWIDQAFVKKDANGKEYWGYGSDWGEGLPSDQNFMCNGIISADYTLHPGSAEVKFAYQYIRFNKTGDGYSVKNYHDFIDLSDYEITWTLMGNGQILKSGKLSNMNLKPKETRYFAAPYPTFEPQAAVEYYVDFSVRYLVDKPFMPAGFEVAHDQFKLMAYKDAEPVKYEPAQMKLTETEKQIRITGENFEIVVLKSDAAISSYQINGTELMQKGPQINFWRPLNDNDKGSNMLQRLGIWREVSNEIQPSKISSLQNDKGKISVTADFKLQKVKSSQTIIYTFTGDGKIQIRTIYKAPDTKLPDMPRFGMRWEMPVNFDNLKWFGRGPHENYIDRNRSAFVGIYTGKVTDQYFKYVRPQENGYKTDTRWFELRNENGIGLRISGLPLVSFSALHNPIEDFDMNDQKDFRHTKDIIKKNGVFICTDLKMMGVAGDDSWGARPYPQYSAPAGEFEFSFTIEPVF